MPIRRQPMLVCDKCNSRFIQAAYRAGVPSCPMCGNPNIQQLKTPPPKVAPPPDPNAGGWLYTGISENGQHLYRHTDGREKWLQHGVESLPHPAGRPDPTTQKAHEKEVKKIQKKQAIKKGQTDYRKLRYKLMKEGIWKGSMEASLNAKEEAK